MNGIHYQFQVLLSEISRILTIIQGFASKASTDCYGVSMKVVTAVINGIILALFNICDFREGLFPSECKTAKDIVEHIIVIAIVGL